MKCAACTAIASTDRARAPRSGCVQGRIAGGGRAKWTGVSDKIVILRSDNLRRLRWKLSASLNAGRPVRLLLPGGSAHGSNDALAVLFQQGALFSSLTVTENIALPLIEHAGLSRPGRRALALVKLALAGLPLSSADKYPSSLSGGMVNGPRWPVPWRWTRTSCFSTSRLPGSTRLGRRRSTN